MGHINDFYKIVNNCRSQCQML